MVDSIHTQVAYTPPDKTEDKKTSNKEADSEFSFWGKDGFSFWDMVDMINPLQHIPVISTAYRSMTGDEIDPGARLAGGTLFGGPIGLAASTFNVVLEHNTGKDAGEHVLALFEGEEVPDDQRITVVKNETTPQNLAVSSFAPVPPNEADAFAAGEASLRMAELEEFMNPQSPIKEIPITRAKTPEASRGAGSVGAWTQPETFVPPAGLQPVHGAQQPTLTSFYQAQQNPEIIASLDVSTPKQHQQFQAKQSHLDSLDALRAFARDVEAQQTQDQAKKIKESPKPVAVQTSQLSQTPDNHLFAEMMAQNMDRYDQLQPRN